jgi:hypothetical protein
MLGDAAHLRTFVQERSFRHAIDAGAAPRGRRQRRLVAFVLTSARVMPISEKGETTWVFLAT